MISWPFDLSVYAGLVALLIVYIVLERGESPGAWRLASAAAGLLTIWAALETPLDGLGDRYLQSAHMAQHMLLMAFAPPLLLLGLTPRGAGRMYRALGPLRALLRPLPALVIYSAAVVGWHVPAAYDLGVTNDTVHIAEHVTFLAAGLAFSWQVVPATSGAGRRALAEAWKIVYMFAGALPMMAVALPLQFSHQVFYAPYLAAPRINSFLTPVVDQNVAGAVMMTMDMGAMLVAAVVILFRWLGREVRTDLDRVIELDRPHGDRLPG